MKPCTVWPRLPVPCAIGATAQIGGEGSNGLNAVEAKIDEPIVSDHVRGEPGDPAAGR